MYEIISVIEQLQSGMLKVQVRDQVNGNPYDRTITQEEFELHQIMMSLKRSLSLQPSTMNEIWARISKFGIRMYHEGEKKP